MSNSLPPLNFLTNSSDYTDYRPAISSDGDVVIFERTPASGGPTKLYTITNFNAPNPVPFLHQTMGPLRLARSQTRPDICWKTGAVAFNGGPSNKSVSGIFWVRANGNNPLLVANTARCVYPTWGPDGSRFVTENSGPQAKPVPCSTIFNKQGVVRPNLSNINGKDSAGVAVFGGMPTVGPNGLPQIAFAGQPALKGWGGSTAPKAKYNQETNYIFLNQKTGNVFTSQPMESGASISSYIANYQGRAPDWSPDGKTIAFESNRSGKGYAIYLCDLASGTITKVTDPTLGGQHAKFFADGIKLILCINHPGGNPSTMGIAWVDISGLLKS
jgi:Tol biopolymer transport system component